MMKGRSARAIAETESLRAKIWELFLGNEFEPGKTQRQIADILSITQQTVSYHINKSLTELKYENATRAEQYLARELKKCALGEARAWEAWDLATKAWKKSIGTVKVITKSGRPEMGDSGVRMEGMQVTIRETHHVGDPHYLGSMMEASREARSWHERRCRLLGLDAPKKIDVVDRRTPESMSDTDLQEAVLKTAETLRTGIYIPDTGKSNGKKIN